MAKTTGRRETGKLAATGLRKLPPGMHGDGGGLWLQVTANGRSWIFRYTFKSRPREMGLGSLDVIGLAEAREQAKECRRLLNGTATAPPVDPIENRRALRAAAKVGAAKMKTFKDCAEEYIASHRAGWGNAKHAGQWESTLSAYAYPVFGALSVGAVDLGLVMKVLGPIWNTKTTTAQRLRGRIEAVLDYAKVQELREGENPARWRGHLDKLLPSPSTVAPVQHLPALHYSEAGAFIAKLRQENGIAARALEFTVLTALRTGAVISARWVDIDFAKRVWTVPAEAMKGKKGQKREHKVPLAPSAITILKHMAEHRENEFVFPGDKQGKPLSNMAMLMLLRRMGRNETTHGFRSTFEDWAYECTGFPPAVVEMALAHTIKSAVERAYRRGDLFEKRQQLMDAWAKFCDQARVASGGNVTQIYQRAAP